MSVSTDFRPRADLPTGLHGSPAATRHRRTAWKDPRLFVGIALVAASALLGAALLDGRGPAAVDVWAARTTLVAGQSVHAADLVRREVGFAEQRDADRYLPADEPIPDGAVLSRDVGAGELLPRGAIRTGTSEALVEVPLEVAPVQVPATVGVGSVVDVWVVPDPALAATQDGPPAAEARVVFADVTVLHLARGSGPLGAGAARQVIVGLGAGQQDVLPTALAGMANGSVVLTTTG